jgi:hypothetical protein
MEPKQGSNKACQQKDRQFADEEEKGVETKERMVSAWPVCRTGLEDRLEDSKEIVGGLEEYPLELPHQLF